MLHIILLCGLFAFARSQTTTVSQCILQESELPINQYVHGCITPPCLLPQLQDAVIDVVFRAPRNIRSMSTRATANVFGININYPLADAADTCRFLTNTYCPLLNGEIVQYTLNMYIESFFPAGISTTIEFRVVDEREDTLWCIRLPVTITSPVTARLEQTLNNTARIPYKS
ncbi:unnamed protein product [Euphydryas editha]|uniref:MD-2-related lipid-recognition domain-containing protein n=1 Tax=Euphydryas editha TaxID=104508 RepID=A0AAU9U737_EUPED|nr:unnamed protein product [Euphydryas editha]